MRSIDVCHPNVMRVTVSRELLTPPGVCRNEIRERCVSRRANRFGAPSSTREFGFMRSRTVRGFLDRAAR